MHFTRSTAAAIAGFALAVVLAACGAGGTNGAAPVDRTAAPSSATAAAHPAPSPTTPTASNPVGIVLSACIQSSNEEELDFVDPATKQVTTRYFPYDGYELQAQCGTSEPDRLVRRSAHNSTYTLLAANLAVDNDGYHTGVLHVAKGMQSMTPNFTDLSSATSDGFGAAVQQTQGAFGPDGYLYFVQITPGGHNPDTTQLMLVDSNGGAPRSIPASHDINSVGITKDPVGPPNYGIFFIPNYGVPQFVYDTWMAVAPDGTWAFWHDNVTNYTHYGVPGTAGTTLVMNDTTPAAMPIIYVDKTSYIGTDGNDLVLTKVVGNTTTNTQLLPATVGDILYPTVNPDRTQIAFILKKQSTAALYTVPIAGGKPTKVEDLDPTMDAQVILDWTGAKK